MAVYDPVTGSTNGGSGSGGILSVSLTSGARGTIPGNATPAAQTVTIIFPGPPDAPTQTVTNTLASGLKIN